MSERCEDSFSNRSLLAKAIESDMQTDEERQLLLEYHSILKAIESDQEKLYKISEMIRNTPGGKTELDISIKKNLEASATNIAERINTNDRKLLNLESSTILKYVLDREKTIFFRF